MGREEEAGKEEIKYNRDRRREGIGRENQEERLSHEHTPRIPEFRK